MTDPSGQMSYQLAQLRVTHAVPAAEVATPEVEEAATQAGRRLRVFSTPDGGSLAALGWPDDGEPEPNNAAGVDLPGLTSQGLAVFALCLAQCWPAARPDPYPGQPTTKAAVTEAAAELGLHLPRVAELLQMQLPATGLLLVDGETLWLGPAVAIWTSEQVAGFRRLRGQLDALLEPRRSS